MSRTILISIFLALLTACGGGGGGGSAPTPSPSMATAPGAPTITTVTPGDGQASIAFAAPTSDGGSVITGYTATCTIPGTSRSGSGSNSPIVVSGLTNNTLYGCSVRATNAIGTGPASTSVSVTPTPPPSESALKQLAATFPAMPADVASLSVLIGRAPIFASGLPYNDLEYTVFDTDYMDGETNGYDTFLPVDPSTTTPGANRIKLISATGNVTLDTTYGGQPGDRIILGTAEIDTPFFLRGSDAIDNDYAVINSFDYKNGLIQLRGSASDYSLLRCTTADGCKTDGYYLFYIAGAQPDLVSFVFRCDDLPPAAGSNRPQSGKALCNASETLSLSDPKQFRFATPVSKTVALSPGQFQTGTRGREIVAGIATDAVGNQYLVGQTDGSFNGGAPADNRIVVARVNADGSRGWVYELPLPEGSLLFDAVADAEYLYAVGRTQGALPGFTNKGRWDAIILKLRLSDGIVVQSSQWGNPGLDGYGNVTLDDAGSLYVSGAGSPASATGTDSAYLVAKYRTADLSNVWRKIDPPRVSGVVLVAEGWGGLTYIPGTAPGQGRLVTGGWFMGSSGSSIDANGFLEVWTDLHLAAPRVAATATIASAGIKADWVLDNVVDSAGNIYAVGYTTGDLRGNHLGAGDAFVLKFNTNLQNPVFRQLGTAQSESFRRVEIDTAGNLYAVGFTYGDWGRSNADPSKSTGDVIVQKLDGNLNPVAALQFGTPHEERSYLSLQGGTLYLGGMTEASLAGANQGSFDAFVVRVDTASLTFKP